MRHTPGTRCRHHARLLRQRQAAHWPFGQREWGTAAAILVAAVARPIAVRVSRGSALVKLDAGQAATVLRYLEVAQEAPSVAWLARLIDAYTRRVPWESASRIARRAAITSTDDCPRWPEQFWQEAIASGTGGTCFESNLAFFALLRAVGYEGYLTINDMDTWRACHTALVMQAGGGRWLVDAGFPVFAPMPLPPVGPVPTAYHTYTLLPEGEHRYRLERDRHPAPYCFTLLDTPVPEEAYRAATTADYGPGGLFLDQLIITRVVDGVVTRFAGQPDGPPVLERFRDGRCDESVVTGDLPVALAAVFSMDPVVLRTAFAALNGRAAAQPLMD